MLLEKKNNPLLCKKSNFHLKERKKSVSSPCTYVECDLSTPQSKMNNKNPPPNVMVSESSPVHSCSIFHLIFFVVGISAVISQWVP